MKKDPRNLTIIMDLYEMTMANGLLDTDYENTVAYFDMFFRRVPDDGGYAIMAGIEQLIDYFTGLEFDESDVAYLKGLNLFSEKFISYLENFKFTCDVWAVPEGTPIFPREPIVTVRGPVMQAMMLETFLLLCVNHQSLIATKANRIVRAAAGRPVMEFGARRAQGADAAYYGALEAVRERGLRVPQDVSLAGYDGVRSVQVVHPRLTTIRQDSDAMGRQAAQRLIEYIVHPATAPRDPVLIPSELLEGESMGENG